MFLSGFCTDLLWALYIRRVSERRRLAAASLSTAIGVMSVVWVFGIEKDVFNALFWLAGLFSGTYAALTIEDKK
jgi:hypothetical protein